MVPPCPTSAGRYRSRASPCNRRNMHYGKYSIGNIRCVPYHYGHTMRRRDGSSRSKSTGNRDGRYGYETTVGQCVSCSCDTERQPASVTQNVDANSVAKNQLVGNFDKFVHRRFGTLRSSTNAPTDKTQTFVGTMYRTYANPSEVRKIQGIRHRG